MAHRCIAAHQSCLILQSKSPRPFSASISFALPNDKQNNNNIIGTPLGPRPSKVIRVSGTRSHLKLLVVAAPTTFRLAYVRRSRTLGGGPETSRSRIFCIVSFFSFSFISFGFFCSFLHAPRTKMDLLGRMNILSGLKLAVLSSRFSSNGFFLSRTNVIRGFCFLGENTNFRRLFLG